MTRHVRHIAAVLALAAGAALCGAAVMEPDAAIAHAAPGAPGDSLSRRAEKILFYERSFRPSTYDAPFICHQKID